MNKHKLKDNNLNKILLKIKKKILIFCFIDVIKRISINL